PASARRGRLARADRSSTRAPSAWTAPARRSDAGRSQLTLVPRPHLRVFAPAPRLIRRPAGVSLTARCSQHYCASPAASTQIGAPEQPPFAAGVFGETGRGQAGQIFACACGRRLCEPADGRTRRGVPRQGVVYTPQTR